MLLFPNLKSIGTYYMLGISCFLISTTLILCSSESNLTKTSALGTTTTTAVAVLAAGATSKAQREEEWKDAVAVIIESLQKGLSTKEQILAQLKPYLPAGTRRKIVSLSESLEGYLDRATTCNELSEYLGSKKTEKVIFDVAYKATQNTLGKNSRDERLFCEDIYKYLRVWLKNGIEYEMALPEMIPPLLNRHFPDNSLYARAFSFIKDRKLDSLLSVRHKFKSSQLILKEVLYQHLTALVLELNKGWA